MGIIEEGRTKKAQQARLRRAATLDFSESPDDGIPFLLPCEVVNWARMQFVGVGAFDLLRVFFERYYDAFTSPEPSFLVSTRVLDKMYSNDARKKLSSGLKACPYLRSTGYIQGVHSKRYWISCPGFDPCPKYLPSRRGSGSANIENEVGDADGWGVVGSGAWMGV